MKKTSISLLQINPELTTNIKISVDSDNDMLFLNSIESNSILSSSQYKNIVISELESISNSYHMFWSNFSNLSFMFNKATVPNNVISSDYNDQISNRYLYMSGVRRTNTNEFLNTGKKHEYEYYAPIYISDINNIPNNFLILASSVAMDTEVTKDNFIDLLDVTTVISNIDLINNKIGRKIREHINSINDSILNVSFSNDVSTYLYGIDINSGVISRKDIFTQDIIENEKTFSFLHGYFTDLLKENMIISANHLNLSFLFNDDINNDWTLSQYMGFYGDVEKIADLAFINTPRLKNNIYLDTDGYFVSYIGGVIKRIDPFFYGYSSNINKNRFNYIEYNGKLYRIDRISSTEYKVVNRNELPDSIESVNINANILKIVDNVILKLDNTNPDFSEYFDNNDVLLLNIFNKYTFKIRHDSASNKYIINYGDNIINLINNIFTINENIISIEDLSCSLSSFTFIDIADYDTDIIDTGFAKFENELKNSINVLSAEPKFYQLDYNYNTFPTPVTNYIVDSNVTAIPVGSEYVATSELYDIRGINSYPIKWGYKDSLSTHDYPYLLSNNSMAGDYNRAPALYQNSLDATDMVLDYFYTAATSSFSGSYQDTITYQSLNIYNQPFDVSSYINNTSYFDDYFGSSIVIDNKKHKIDKYSIINNGETLYKGAKFIFNDLNVDGYRFTILLSGMSHDLSNDLSVINSYNSGWKQIKIWGQHTSYYTNDIVFFNATEVYTDTYGFNGYSISGATSGTVVPTPYVYPDGSTEQLQFDDNSFISATSSRGVNDGINQLYICTSDISVGLGDYPTGLTSSFTTYPSGRTIFFQPNRVYSKFVSSLSYSTLMNNRTYLLYVCYYKGEYYYANQDFTNSNRKSPDHITISSINLLQIPDWVRVELYDYNKVYTENTLVVFESKLYLYDISINNIRLVHNFGMENKEYGVNAIIRVSNKYFFNISSASWLYNGINIYKNNDNKSLIIHIYSNDSVFGSLYNVDRDTIYNNSVYNILTLYKVSNYLAGLSNPFVIPMQIVDITDNNYEILSYVNNISVNDMTIVNINRNSIEYKPITTNITNRVITNKLIDNTITNISNVDYYDNTPLNFDIEFNTNNNLINETYQIYRYSGKYTPILKKVELFSDNDNKKFDITLTDFGMIRLNINKVSIDNPIVLNNSSIKVDMTSKYFGAKYNIFKSIYDKKLYYKF